MGNAEYMGEMKMSCRPPRQRVVGFEDEVELPNKVAADTQRGISKKKKKKKKKKRRNEDDEEFDLEAQLPAKDVEARLDNQRPKKKGCCSIKMFVIVVVLFVVAGCGGYIWYSRRMKQQQRVTQQRDAEFASIKKANNAKEAAAAAAAKKAEEEGLPLKTPRRKKVMRIPTPKKRLFQNRRASLVG